MPDNKLKQYYDKQVSEGRITSEKVPFEKFSGSLQDEGKRKQYYDKQVSEGRITSEKVPFEKFSETLGFIQKQEESKGVQATGESSEFQSPFISGGFSSDSIESNEQIPSAPVSDESIDLYEQYREVIGGTITTEQESEINSLLQTDLSVRQNPSFRADIEARGEDFDSYKDLSFEDFEKTTVASTRRLEAEKSFKTKNRREFLESLSDEDRVSLKNKILPLYQGKTQEVEDLASEIEIQKSYLSKVGEVGDRLKQIKESGGEFSEEDIEFAKEASEKYLDVVKSYQDNELELSKAIPELGSFEEQLSALKRTNSWIADTLHRTGESIFGAIDSITTFVGDLPTTAGVPVKELHSNIYDPIKKEIESTLSFAESHKKEDIALDAIETPADFLKWGKDQFVAQTGNLLLAASGSPELAFLGLGASAGGSKTKELEQKGTFSKEQIQQAALFEFIKGGSVGLVERGILGRATGALKNTSKLLKTPKGKVATEAILDTGIGTGSEVADQVLSNAYSIQVLGEKDVHILDNWKEAALSSLVVQGTIQGTSKGTPIAINEASKAVRKAKDKKAYKINKDKAQSLYDQMQSLSDDNPLKKDLQKKVSSLLEENTKIIQKDTEILGKLTEADAKAIVESDNKLKKLFEKRKEIEVTKELQEDVKKELFEDNAEQIKKESRKKEEVVDNVGYDKDIRKQAIKAVYDRKAKLYEEAGAKGDKPVVTKKDIDKEYNKILEQNQVDRLNSFEETFNPLVDHLEIAAKDLTKDTKIVRRDYIESVKNSDYYKSLGESAQQALIRNSEETVDRFLQKNKRFEKETKDTGVKAKLLNVVHRIEQNLVDSLGGVRREVTNTYGESKSRDFIEKTKLYKGVTRNKVQNFSKRVSSFIGDIEKDFNLREFDILLKDLHAEEANAHSSKINADNLGFAGGINVVESKKRLAALSPEQRSALDKLSNKYQEFVTENRENSRDTGRIDEETFNAFEDFYENYIDLRGFNNDKIDIKNEFSSKRGLSSKGVDGQKRKGRSTESGHVISNLMNAYAKTVEEGQKDLVIQSLEGLYDKDSNSNPFEIYDSGELPLIAKENPDKRIAYFSEGKRKYIVFDNPDFNRAFNQADVLGKSVLAKALKSYTGFIKQTITSFSLEFAPTNFLRDSQVAFRSIFAELDSKPEFKDVDSKKVAKYMRNNIIKGSGRVSKVLVGRETGDAKIDKYGKEFLESGAVTGVTRASFESVQAKIKNQAEFYKKGKKAKLAKTKELLNFVGTGVEHYNAIFENVHRFNAFVAVREQGVPTQTAARLAKDLTVDFDQSGDWGSAASSVYYFFNAAVQGNVRFFNNVRKLRRDKDGKVVGLTRAQKGLIALPTFTFMNTLATLSFAEEDEDLRTFYEKDPEYLKRNSIRFYTGADDGTTATIPLSYGSNVLAYAGVLLAEVAMEVRSPSDAIYNLVGATVDITSPISVSGSEDNSILDTFVPSVLQPIGDIATNENFFGSPIHTEKNSFNENTPDSQKGKKNTPEVYKAVASLINETTGGNEFESGWFDAHPESYEYFLESSLGGISKITSNLWNTGESIADDDKEVKINKVPFLRKFLHTPSDYNSIREFQDKSVFLEQRVQALWADYNKNKEENPDKANSIKVEGEKVRRVLDEYEVAKKELLKVYKARKKLDSNTNEDFVKKRSKELEKVSVRISKRLNGFYNQVLGKTYK